MLGVVVLGGVLGVALRELLLLPFSGGQAASDSLVLPVATLVVNVLGSFALGIVVGRLGDRHPLTRAFVGTGVLGGFTTYSAFAVQTASLLAVAPVAGLALAVVSVLLGLAAAALGLHLTRRPPASDRPEAAA
jgi:fluoride exporter